MKKWEYSMPYYSNKPNADILNDMGSQGWELISIFQSPDDEETYRWIFKRERVEENKPFDGD